MAPGPTPSKRSRRTIQAKARYHASMILRMQLGMKKFDKLVKRNKRRSEGIVLQKEVLVREKRELPGILTRERDELLDIQTKVREAAAAVHSKISEVLVGGSSGGELSIVEASNYLAGTGGGIVHKMARIQDLQKRGGEVDDNLNKLNKIQDDVCVEGRKMPAVKDAVSELQDEMTDFLEIMKDKLFDAIEGMVSENECESDEEESDSDNECGTFNPEDILGAEDIAPCDVDTINEWGRRNPYYKGKPFGDRIISGFVSSSHDPAFASGGAASSSGGAAGDALCYVCASFSAGL